MQRGGPYMYHLREQAPRGKVHVRGTAVCECGAYSTVLPSGIDRAEWHRQHVADVIAGKTQLL